VNFLDFINSILKLVGFKNIKFISQFKANKSQKTIIFESKISHVGGGGLESFKNKFNVQFECPKLAKKFVCAACVTDLD